MNGFIYMLVCPFEKKPLYVGATKDPKKRKVCHMTGNGDSLISAYIQTLKKKKRTLPEFKIIEECDASVMNEREAFHIRECEKLNPYILNISKL